LIIAGTSLKKLDTWTWGTEMRERVLGNNRMGGGHPVCDLYLLDRYRPRHCVSKGRISRRFLNPGSSGRKLRTARHQETKLTVVASKVGEQRRGDVPGQSAKEDREERLG
jgi:hypothetical protein